MTATRRPTEFVLFDVVAARVHVPAVGSERSVARGEQGTIVEIIDRPRRAYMVEFDDDEGLALPILTPDQLERVERITEPARQAA